MLIFVFSIQLSAGSNRNYAVSGQSKHSFGLAKVFRSGSPAIGQSHYLGTSNLWRRYRGDTKQPIGYMQSISARVSTMQEAVRSRLVKMALRRMATKFGMQCTSIGAWCVTSHILSKTVRFNEKNANDIFEELNILQRNVIKQAIVTQKLVEVVKLLTKNVTKSKNAKILVELNSSSGAAINSTNTL
jgi:hypothetical protein